MDFRFGPLIFAMIDSRHFFGIGFIILDRLSPIFSEMESVTKQFCEF